MARPCAEMSRSLEISKANAKGANNMSGKMGRNSHSNWWATDVSKYIMNDLLTITEQGPQRSRVSR